MNAITTLSLTARLTCCVGFALLAGCQANGTAPVPERNAFAEQRTASPALTERRATATAVTGIVIPLYVDPGAQWDRVISLRIAHPNVPFIIIANVNNGPGTSSNASYASSIARAQAAGVSVIGYVFTSNGKRAQTAVDSQMLLWNSYYHVNGIFLDEMSSNATAYYTAITAYAHAHSLPFVMGNPGDNAPGNAGPDVINFYETSGYPALSFLEQSAHTTYGKARWSYMAGAVPFDAATITAGLPYVAYIYATDGAEPECYCKLPTYLTKLVDLLATQS